MRRAASSEISAARPDILDRNGEMLATDVKMVSVFAEPRNIVDKDEAVELLTAVLPDLDARELRDKLGTKKGFVWVKREITPRQQAEVHRLGIPGVGFLPENKRVYPNGAAAAHVLGFANIDNVGIAGIEKYIDSQGLQDLNGAGFNIASTDLKPVQLSARPARRSTRCATNSRRAWPSSRPRRRPASIMDVNTGEVIALVSLPDFDPNNPVDALEKDRINRINVGVFEMGSTFKALTTAMALDSGKFNINSTPRCALRPALRQVHHRRLSRDAPGADRAGGLHPLLEHRHGAHGARRRRRGAQGLPEEDGPARPPAHGAARERGADRARRAGASSTRSPSPSATASPWRRSRPRWRSARS